MLRGILMSVAAVGLIGLGSGVASAGHHHHGHHHHHDHHHGHGHRQFYRGPVYGNPYVAPRIVVPRQSYAPLYRPGYPVAPYGYYSPGFSIGYSTPGFGIYYSR